MLVLQNGFLEGGRNRLRDLSCRTIIGRCQVRQRKCFSGEFTHPMSANGWDCPEAKCCDDKVILKLFRTLFGKWNIRTRQSDLLTLR